ncbi:MAG: hypothetical protein JWP29_3333, partial [Rhodoferax sp.]|nr:hypothetical protein [Rhodoferax sp.]
MRVAPARGLWPLWLSATVFAVAGAPAVHSQPLPPPPARGAPLQTVLFLELVVNELASGQVVQVLVRDGHYYIGAAVLQSLHVRTGTGPDAQVAVDQLAGVTVFYDSTGQRLKIVVPPEWLPAQLLGAVLADNPFTPLTGSGGLINYDLYASNPGGDRANLSVLSEQRLFGPWGSLSNSGVYRHTAQGLESGFMRYDTRWTHSDPDAVRTATAGDLIAAPLSWGSALRLGGLQLARNFAVRPDLVTYPLPKFSGQAAVPSAVDLFINGYKAGSEPVQPGPFTLNTQPYINGAGEAAVVTTDALGRQVVTTVPFYVANTLLKKGLDDYSYAVGALRRSYGQKNFDYGPLVGSGAYRFGLNDTVTLEGRAEAAGHLAVLGAGGLLALGSYGVVNAAASQSAVRGTSGSQLNVGYQFNGRRFGLGAQHTARTTGYADLTNYDSPGLHLARRSSQVNTSVSMGDAGALAAGYFDALAADNQRTRLLSLNYSKPVGSNAFVSVNVNKAVGGREMSVQLLLTFALDNRAMVSTAIGRDRDHTSAQVNYSRTPPTEGGFGWNLGYADSGTGTNGRYSQASATWRTDVTQLQAGAS